MNNARIAIICAALALVCAGCESTESEKKQVIGPPQQQEQPQKKRQTTEQKKRKSLRDPIADMLSIERKESKPLVADSEVLSQKEREAFSSSWSSQHKEAEEIHRKVRSQHDKEKKKADSWVFFD